MSELDPRELSTENSNELDPVAEHYVTQYSAAELRTFHCDRVRKIPLSGLDPSMLLGFLCKDEADWIDLRKRVNEVGVFLIPTGVYGADVLFFFLSRGVRW